MNVNLHLRAVPPPALRNSATWLRKLFDGDHGPAHDQQHVLGRPGPDHQILYTDTVLGDQAVLGGGQVCAAGPQEPPFLLLTAAQTARVATFLAAADFDALWRPARAELLPRYGGPGEEPRTRAAFAEAHHELAAFYRTTALHRDAVVKWLMP